MVSNTDAGFRFQVSSVKREQRVMSSGSGSAMICFGTGFQPAFFAGTSYPETSSPVSQSIGFQPKP